MVPRSNNCKVEGALAYQGGLIRFRGQRRKTEVEITSSEDLPEVWHDLDPLHW